VVAKSKHKGARRTLFAQEAHCAAGGIAGYAVGAELHVTNIAWFGGVPGLG
jgi:hypothetical protein